MSNPSPAWPSRTPMEPLASYTKQSTNPFIGLRWDGNKLVWDEKELEIIKLIFKLAPNYGARVIAKKLRKKGFKNRRGNPITPRAISHILARKEYRQIVGPLYDKVRKVVERRKLEKKVPTQQKKENKENFKELRRNLIQLVGENRRLKIENEKLRKKNRRLRAKVRDYPQNEKSLEDVYDFI